MDRPFLFEFLVVLVAPSLSPHVIFTSVLYLGAPDPLSLFLGYEPRGTDMGVTDKKLEKIKKRTV